MLALLVSLVLLVVWVVTSGGPGGDGGSDQGGGQGGGGAVSSITPGPSSSESLISEHPGGRDEVGGGTGSADGDTDGSEGSGEPDGTGGPAGSGGGADGEGGGGTGEGSGPGSGGANGGADMGVSVGAEAVPAGSGLPDCSPGSVVVTLRSVENRYAPGKKPTFRLTVRNSGDRDCKVDFGSKATVFTITEAGSGDDRVWRSRDCPKGEGSALYRVPADGTAVRTLEWDRRHSAPGCGTPGGTVGAGTYLIEAEVKGLKTVRTSFVLTKD